MSISHSWQVTGWPTFRWSGDKAPHLRSGEKFYCSRSMGRWFQALIFVGSLIGKMMENWRWRYFFWAEWPNHHIESSMNEDRRFIACLKWIYVQACSSYRARSEFQCLEMHENIIMDCQSETRSRSRERVDSRLAQAKRRSQGQNMPKHCLLIENASEES